MFRSLRTTMLFRRLVFFMILPLLITMITPACSQKKATEPTPTPENDFQSLEADAQRRQDWIDRMDPFVSQNKDSTFSLDWAGFIAQYSSLSEADQAVVNEFAEGIPVVNAMVLNGELDNMSCGYACWWYWWGQRCCYWGSTGVWAVALLCAGSALPVIGWGFIIFCSWATALQTIHGGFCANRSWVGGIWLTAP